MYLYAYWNQKSNQTILSILCLTDCGLVMSYGVYELGYHGFRWCFVACSAGSQVILSAPVLLQKRWHRIIVMTCLPPYVTFDTMMTIYFKVLSKRQLFCHSHDCVPSCIINYISTFLIEFPDVYTISLSNQIIFAAEVNSMTSKVDISQHFATLNRWNFENRQGTQ